MTEYPKKLTGERCFHFTCLNKATTHDPIISDNDGVVMYVPVCCYHKSIGSQKGKFGFLTDVEVKWFKRFVKIIRFFGRRAER